MTDKINTIFGEFDKIDNVLSTSSTINNSIKSIITNINSNINKENTKIDDSLRQFRPIEGVIPVAGGNYNKTFLNPTALRDTYLRIKMTGGSKDDVRNMIYTIEKMQNSGINRDFFPKLLTALKARR
jgi:hypothetical protein